MFSLIKRMFSGRMSPGQVVHHFRQHSDAFAREEAELSLESKRQRSLIEAILNRGKEAARNGDSLGKRQAAMELKSAQLEAAAVEREVAKVLNAQTFVRLTLRKLERCSRNQLGRAYAGLSRLMNDGSFQKLLVAAGHNHAEVEGKIGSALERAFDETPEHAEVLAMDTGIFDELARADEAGDIERVKALKRKAGGRVETSLADSAAV